MFTGIFSAVFVVAVITMKPVAKVIGKVAEAISAKKEEKEARRRAVENYLSREIIDIEH